MSYILGKKSFNGKPAAHWERLAKKAVIETLVGASLSSDTRSVIGKMTSLRFMSLALSEDRMLVAEIMEERTECAEYVGKILAMCLPDPPKKPRSKKKK